MADAEVTICSNALTMLGANPIASLTENTADARRCNRLYPITRDAVVQRAPWKCSLQRAILAQNATGPLFGFTYAFNLPATAICLWATSLDVDEGGDGTPWQVEGRTLVSDASAVSILFGIKVTDTLLFDPMLEQAITFALAAALAFPTTQNANLMEKFDQMAERVMARALARDGKQGTKRRYRSTMLTLDVR